MTGNKIGKRTKLEISTKRLSHSIWKMEKKNFNPKQRTDVSISCRSEIPERIEVKKKNKLSKKEKRKKHNHQNKKSKKHKTTTTKELK